MASMLKITLKRGRKTKTVLCNPGDVWPKTPDNYQGNDSRTWGYMTRAQVAALADAYPNSIAVYPRKKIVVINGFLKWHLKG